MPSSFRCTADAAFRLVTVEPGLCDILGAPPSSLIGHRWVELTGPEDHAAILRYEQALRDGEPCFPIGFTLSRADGDTVLAERIDQRQPDGTYAIAIRISEESTADASDGPALAEARTRRAQAEHFLTQIIEAVADPIFVKDADHRWILLNEPMCAFMGRPRSELIGKSDYDFFPAEQADVFRAKDAEVFERGGVSVNQESFDDAAGVTHTISTKKTVFTDAEGNKVLVGVIRDMTAEVEALEQAQAATRAKSAFIAMMSHEIRTPLNGVIGLADMLLATRLDETQTEYARLAKRSGEALLALVSDVLDLARIEAGRLELHAAPFDLDLLVRDTAALFRFDARRKGLTLEQIVDPELGWIEADAVRIGQVLINLLGNAVKFTAEGQVAIRGMRDGDRITIAVSDTGIGIDQAARAHLFEPFTQAESSIGRRFGGTGLGLTICRELLAAMDSALCIESTPGVGSSFSFTLVAPRIAPQSIAPPALDAVQPHLKTGRVLLVEDNPVNQRVGRHMLEMLGQEVDLAESGLAALGALRQGHYDAVLMDCHMPGLDGFETTRRARALPGEGARVPIIALTADAAIETRQMCVDAGMDDYLTKPIALTRLATTLARWMPSDTDI